MLSRCARQRPAIKLLRRTDAPTVCSQARFSTENNAQAFADFGLTDDQQEFRVVAQEFARKELQPFAAEWDATKHFPIDKLRAAAQLGFGGILVGDDVGEQRLSTVLFSGHLELSMPYRQHDLKTCRRQCSWQGRCCSDL